eukprot:CAMPEP_0172698672 /NCGR_PEP_ID=MMETSP1074-20121228/29642_1 /TAXON_ID=2916 /ORGANISM="Ceratium fusus, Strain PA161109" /LENGTH=44 /DNA_ID= /DNA_START= /DNA_END= /DNA_ORIENTATION=
MISTTSGGTKFSQSELPALMESVTSREPPQKALFEELSNASDDM